MAFNPQSLAKKFISFRLIRVFHLQIGCFDVYNIETALPAIDLETIENHLKLVKDDERRVSEHL